MSRSKTFFSWELVPWVAIIVVIICAVYNHSTYMYQKGLIEAQTEAEDRQAAMCKEYEDTMIRLLKSNEETLAICGQVFDMLNTSN